MNKKLRIALSISVVLITISLFIYYISNHKYLLTRLLNTPPTTVLFLLLLYFAWFIALTMILQASLRICNVFLSKQENLMLNAYSTLVNFFIPGQGGPAVRGLYLKKRHGLSIRKYIITTLLIYLFYGIVSLVLVLIGTRPWWQSIIGIVFIIGAAILAALTYSRKKNISKYGLDFSLSNFSYLLIATLVQALIQVIIYYTELHSVGAHVSARQVFTYTGVANLALFVALTPGAIGIRESFLLFSRRLHHISSSNIVAANIIDRSVFLVLLAALFIMIASTHARDKLQLKQISNKSNG
jgi:uncharacterized membrane protein YbhN (UPF0104 family)